MENSLSLLRPFTSYRFRYRTAAPGIRPGRGFSFSGSARVAISTDQHASNRKNASGRVPNSAPVRRILPRNRNERATSRPRILPRLRILGPLSGRSANRPNSCACSGPFRPNHRKQCRKSAFRFSYCPRNTGRPGNYTVYIFCIGFFAYLFF